MEPKTKHFKKREAILDCLRSTGTHPTADWVHAQLRQEYPDISLGTVYRNLALFKEQGIIQSLGTVGGVERFDWNTAPHVHFICQSCDAVMDLHEVEIPRSLTASAMACGQVTGCQLTFTGRCRDCLEKEESA